MIRVQIEDLLTDSTIVHLISIGVEGITSFNQRYLSQSQFELPIDRLSNC